MVASALLVKTVVATGVTAGCGRAAIRQLISRNDGPYNVIIGSRRPESSETEAAAKELLSCRKSRKTSITYLPLDLLSHQSVGNFSALVRDHLGAETKIDIFLHCGGMLSNKRNILTLPNGKQAEETIVVNTLSPVLLTRRLLDCLAPTARVTIVSSVLHNRAPQNMTPKSLDEELGPKQWTGVKAYSISKLLLIHFALILRDDPAFSGRRVISLHPGYVPNTNLLRDMSRPVRWISEKILPYLPGTMTVEQGGAVIVRGMTDEEFPSGSYLEPKGLSQYSPQLDKPELRQQWAEWFSEQGVLQ